jgi:hypothetical protein
VLEKNIFKLNMEKSWFMTKENKMVGFKTEKGKYFQ